MFRKKAAATMIVVFSAAVILGSGLSAEALTISAKRGTTGRVWLNRDPNTGTMPDVHCNWNGSNAEMQLTGFYLSRAGRGLRTELVRWRYRVKYYEGANWKLYTQTAWNHHRIRRTLLVFGPDPFFVTRGYAYSVWLDVRWYLHPRNPTLLGRKRVSWDWTDFSFADNSTPLMPISYSPGGLGWCAFAP
jgi:hypothetical protein